MKVLTVSADLRRIMASSTLDNMIDGYRKDTQNHLGELTSSDVEAVAETILSVMETQPSGTELMAWVLALAIDRLQGE